jgi:hypothetical protein
MLTNEIRAACDRMDAALELIRTGGEALPSEGAAMLKSMAYRMTLAVEPITEEEVIQDGPKKRK